MISSAWKVISGTWLVLVLWAASGPAKARPRIRERMSVVVRRRGRLAIPVTKEFEFIGIPRKHWRERGRKSSANWARDGREIRGGFSSAAEPEGFHTSSQGGKGSRKFDEPENPRVALQ